MLDIRYIRAHADEVQAAARHKGYEVSIAALLACDNQRRELQQQVDAVRTTRNETAAQMKGGKPSQELIAKGKALKAELATLEEELRTIENNFFTQLEAVPNITLPDVPLGGEADSVEIKQWGERRESAQDHLGLRYEPGLARLRARCQSGCTSFTMCWAT